MVKNFLKLNQTRYRVSPGYVDCKTKGIFGIASLGKSKFFIRKCAIISNNLRLLNFKNWSFFIGSRSYSN